MVDYYNPHNDIENSPMEGCLGYLIGAIIGVAICLIMSCCSSPKVITNTVVQHDTLKVSVMQHDSTWVHDSVFVDRWMRGDTCFLTKYVEHTQWRDRWRTDTLYKVKTDSVDVTKIKEVERELTKWQVTQMFMGDVFALLLLAGIVYILTNLYKRFV